MGYIQEGTGYTNNKQLMWCAYKQKMCSRATVYGQCGQTACADDFTTAFAPASTQSLPEEITINGEIYRRMHKK